MQTRSKKIFLFVFLLSLNLFSVQVIAQTNSNQNTGYQLLAPIPLNGTNMGDTASVTVETITQTYIPGIIKLIIGIAGALAVIMIVFGGFEYISTASGLTKTSAKGTISNALIGLFLAIGSWLILNTLNPKLVNFNLDVVKPVNQSPGADTGTTTGLTTPPEPTTPLPSDVPDTTGITPEIGPTTVAWMDDAQWRNTLLAIPNVSFNHDGNCKVIGEKNCTSVAGLSYIIISRLQTLEQACNCTIRITGGTEYWAHDHNYNDINKNTSPHKPNGLVMDFSLDGSLTSFLRRAGHPLSTTNCTSGTERYEWGGTTFVNEVGVEQSTGPHWHACFYNN